MYYTCLSHCGLMVLVSSLIGTTEAVRTVGGGETSTVFSDLTDGSTYQVGVVAVSTVRHSLPATDFITISEYHICVSHVYFN